MSYLIKKSTIALIPHGKKTRIMELNYSKVVNQETVELIDANCRTYGSTLEGRQKGSAYLIGTSYKPPIILNEIEGIILIPTRSSRNSDCIWLNLDMILNYDEINSKKARIEFKNLKKLDVNISYNKLEKQILRATRLELLLKNRKLEKHL